MLWALAIVLLLFAWFDAQETRRYRKAFGPDVGHYKHAAVFATFGAAAALLAVLT